jgi:hypothetical protein
MSTVTMDELLIMIEAKNFDGIFVMTSNESSYNTVASMEEDQLAEGIAIMLINNPGLNLKVAKNINRMLDIIGKFREDVLLNQN